MAWITTKDGKHINTDWFDKEKQIADNAKEADKKNGKTINGKFYTREELKKNVR